MLELPPQHELLVTPHQSPQGPDEVRAVRADPPVHVGHQHLRVRLPTSQGVEDAGPGLAHHVTQQAAELNVGAFEPLLDAVDFRRPCLDGLLRYRTRSRSSRCGRAGM